MDLTFFIDFIIHFDKYLGEIINNFGGFAYLFLFLIVFLETGLVFTPFLPGDSLLFVAGAFAAQDVLNILLLFVLLSAAAVLGDSVNYWVGFKLGDKISKSRFIKKEHLDRTHEFYRKHGGKTIILARFVPIVRTFAPFVAGVGKMNYKKFFGFNFIGGIIWVALFLFAGFFFGNIPFVEERLTLFILIIIFLSFVPIIVEFVRHKRKRYKNNSSIKQI